MCFSFISYFVLSDGPLRGIALFSGEILAAMFANPFEDFKGVSGGPLVVMQQQQNALLSMWTVCMFSNAELFCL